MVVSPRDHLRLGQSSDGQQHQGTMHLGFRVQGSGILGFGKKRFRVQGLGRGPPKPETLNFKAVKP